MAVSNKLLGEMDRCRNTPQPVSTAKSKGCRDGHKPEVLGLCETQVGVVTPAGSPTPDTHPAQALTHLQRAVEITVQVSLQEGRPQDLGLWAQQGGPEHVTRQAFLRHLWASGGHIPSGRRLRDNC